MNMVSLELDLLLGIEDLKKELIFVNMVSL